MNLAIKTVGVALAAAALCGFGVAAASAATPNAAASARPSTPAHAPNQLRDAAPFRVDLVNNTTSPLTIYTYQGSDWDTVDGTPPVGSVIAKGQEIGVFLYSHGGASDAVGLKPTDYAGNLGLGIYQDHLGGDSEQVLADSTLNINVRSSGDGYHIVAITNPAAYSTETLLAYSASLSGLQSTGIPAYTCPADPRG